jgi:hypothetical protein
VGQELSGLSSGNSQGTFPLFLLVRAPIQEVKRALLFRKA